MERFGRALSQRLTRHEVIFMRRLTLSGKIQFDFQVQIGPYFADFVFPDRMLIIEVDGESHRRQREYDAERDEFMRGLGFTVWRIQNKEVGHWPITRILNFQSIEQSDRTYNQTIEFAILSGFRPTEPRRKEPARRFQELDVAEPDFYTKLINRINNDSLPDLLM